MKNIYTSFAPVIANSADITEIANDLCMSTGVTPTAIVPIPGDNVETLYLILSGDIIEDNEVTTWN